MNNGETITVLVIDDQSVIRESIAACLIQHDYRVVLAEDGAQGVACFHSSCPDLILYGLGMSGDENGLEALRNILWEAPEQPVILLAPAGETACLVEAMKLGVTDYLFVPADNMELLGLVIANNLKRARLITQNTRYRKKLEEINRELEERIEIFRFDQQAGRHVQMSVLPESPETICGYRFAHCIIPSLYLSGDSVDYKPVSRSKVLFYIADVSGHGSSSAFVTVLLRFRMEQMRREFIRGRFSGSFTPASILGSLNKDLLDAGLEKHITMFMGMLDSDDKTLTYSVAGHYPLPVLYVTGRSDFIELEKHSFPLGLVRGAEYPEQVLALHQPFSLILFSDGILETLSVRKIEDKEGYILHAVTRSQGDFGKLKSSLNLENLANVPDDIAMMSVTGQ